jgi:hypothetical protein
MWAQALAAAAGVWLMAAPDVLGYGDPAAANDRIVGPVAASVAIIALSESTRSVRWVNLALGAWLCTAPWMFGFPATAAANSFACGVLLAVLSMVRGRLRYRLAGGWRALR